MNEGLKISDGLSTETGYYILEVSKENTSNCKCTRGCEMNYKKFFRLLTVEAGNQIEVWNTLTNLDITGNLLSMEIQLTVYGTAWSH